MAVLTAQGISSLSVALLTRSLVLPMTVSRISGGEFAGDNGDTITVRVPQPGSARTQATPGATITYDDVTEIPVDVSLSHLYHGKLVSDEELSLDLVDFGRQITRVQVVAVATGAEDELAGAMNGLAADASFDLSATAANTEASILAAREALSSADAPNGDRWFVVSPDIATRILSVDKFVRVDASGSDSALRQALIGRLYGFNFVESNALTAGTALAYHMSGFAFANRVPVTPRGANQSATANKDGIGLRHIFQYVPDVLSDASVVSTFAGAAAVADDGTGINGTSFPRVYKFDTSAT